MRDRPPVAHRLTAVAVIAGLLAPMLPGAVVAQDEAAVAVTDAFEVVVDVGDPTGTFAWSVKQPDVHWRIEATGPAEERLRLQLRDAAGDELSVAHADGRVVLFDQQLDPGAYEIEMVDADRNAFGFTLSASPEPDRFDPEPNDRLEDAALLQDGVPAPGRLAWAGNDHWRLTVPPGDAWLRDISLASTGGPDRQLCLLTLEGERRQCRSASELPLRDLALEPGEHILHVSGPVDEAAPYELLVDLARERAADYEAEPNDDFLTASPMDATLGISGRSHLRDEDVLALDVEGDMQLWRIEATGDQVDYLHWLRAGTDVVAQSSPRCDGTTAVLEDLYLAPGTHRFLVRTCDGPYRLTATPLGVPDPDGELEPNSDEVRAERYAAGERRVGRLASLEDRDYFRFTLAAPELIDLRLAQPADAVIRATLYAGGAPLYQGEPLEPGAELQETLSLQPGDYLLELRGMTPSEGQYELLTTPLDPWLVPADAEPNDDPGTARAVPPSLAWSGIQDTRYDDHDAVWLPPLAVAGPVRVEVENERPNVRLFHGPYREERVDVERQEDGSFLASDAPAGVPLYLEIEADGAYDVVVTMAGLEAEPAPILLPVGVEITAATDRLAAYWPEGQAVDAAITLTSAADATLELELAARSSHYAWQLEPASDTVTLEPGGSVTIPARVTTRADLWADVPVRLSVMAAAADASYATGVLELQAAREAEAVGSHLAWPVPAALVSGLNVAGAALGAVPGGTVVPDREPFLFDDVTPAGTGFGLNHDGSPLELTVDLAGTAPVPVAGVILNPLARDSRLEEAPRAVEVDLSTDGQTWRTVLRSEMSPLPIDQSFVLEAPEDATHARLRILSTHGQDPRVRGVAVGEWKVIAVPGAIPDEMPANIAEPVRGGHVARHTPFINGIETWARLLDDDLKRLGQSRDRQAGEALDIVIGFQEGRAARITSIRWLDPEGTDPTQRAAEVDVAITTDGPTGPWRSLGRWALERAADGSVAPFDLPTPAWARYVRLTAPPMPDEVGSLEFPGKLEVLEQPSDGEYRSILGEWGYTSDRGPYELLEPNAATELVLSEDAGDTLEEATTVELGGTRFDRATILEDEDWYRIEVPANQNLLQLDLEGVPSVGVRATLFDAAGAPVPLRRLALEGGRETYEANVEAGDHFLRIEQPPFSVAFTFDTSGSMGPYLDFVLEGMRVFASDVQPGREVAKIFPFDRPPLIDTWQDQPIALETAVNDYVPANDSSNVEVGLLDSANALRDREGTRAILAVADAETGTLNMANDVWAAFEAVSPTVYTVHVGADRWPDETRDLMRAWSDTNAGVYSYPTTHAEMERAFDRMSTHLRRPATYGLAVDTDFVDLRPGTLEVIAPEGTQVGLAGGTGLALILDTSGSMNKRLDGKRRIDIAKGSLKRLISDGLADGVPVSLRVFGGTGKRTGCETRQLVELGPLRKARTIKLVERLKIQKNTGTPIAAALRAVRDDLADVEGERIVVLITDGKATCKEDPEAAIAELRDAGTEVSLNIVGFALDDEAVKEQMRGWALANSGSYYDAADAAALTEAVTAAVAAPVDVYALEAAPDTEPVASTTVGAPPLELPPGQYRLEIRSEPVQQPTVEILPGDSTRYELLPAQP